MESHILIEELERLRGGQPDAERRLLFAISRSSLFLVSESEPDTTGDDAIVVKSRLMTVEGRPTACLFSSQDTLREWCAQHGCASHSVPIHGGDLTFLMPSGTWILIDPGTPHEVELSPDQLSQVNQEMPDINAVMVTTKEEYGGFEMPAKAADDKDPSGFTMHAVPVDVRAVPVIAAPQGPIKRRFSPRTSPTVMFDAPIIDKKEQVLPERKRTMTSSNLKKIIKSLPPGTE